jgi:hypothetical protein
LERQEIFVAEEQTSHGRKLHDRATSSFLKVLLVIVGMMAAIATIFHVHILPEIIGLTGLVLTFWLITEATGWKSTPVPDEFISSAGPGTGVLADRMFRSLPDDCTVFHDIDTGYGRIEHILLSRKYGLFVIETKQHPGKVTSAESLLVINNLPPEQDFFVKVLWNSFWLREKVRESSRLDALVTPVIVFANATVDVIEPVNGVIVTDPDGLPASILKAKINPEISASLWAIHESGALVW